MWTSNWNLHLDLQVGLFILAFFLSEEGDRPVLRTSKLNGLSSGRRPPWMFYPRPVSLGRAPVKIPQLALSGLSSLGPQRS